MEPGYAVNEPAPLGAWADEIAADLLALDEESIRLIMGPVLRGLIQRMRDAPRVEPYQQPLEALSAAEQRELGVTPEDRAAGFVWLSTAPPPSAFTVGELAQLRSLLDQAAERAVRLAPGFSLRAAQQASRMDETARMLRYALSQLQP